ncbi:leucyl aminopeptidase LAP [Cardiosporidium cionae]|uniref:Leucyl aminopeptidase LAP n=1 Tax=Cardiosporidium cionae TaxID=476202 RepID=A0ABQ7JAM8_9APIC|nr:leucyl aminopeptidase LAP [Cardiosporidium cionae]|eukprot:KAF8821034.1 leucyl aminopeptidase LAP [Cardiosporidium cionae]
MDAVEIPKNIERIKTRFNEKDALFLYRSSKYVRLPRNSKVRSLGIVGLGTAEKSAPRHGLVIAKEIVNVANEQKSATLQLVFPAGISANVVQSILESLFISLSPHVAFFSDEAKRLSQEIVTNISLILPVALRRNSQEIVDTARIYARGVYFAQELVNAPPNYCNTVSLANAAVTLAKDFGLTYRILDQKDAEKEGMGAYLGVAKGSMFPPKFIHLTYEGKGTITDTMAFVGKGIVFDSGGYNIKSMASLMDFMKIDMGGAAAVLGAAYCIGLLKPEGHRIHFIVAAAENMVSSSAYRPGDIITASNGTTIQVLNTDAEGRLTLADALLYARKLGAETIIDLATLTGACMVALVLFAESKGELLHELPLVPEYDESLDSIIADVNNIDKTGYGGSITAALFLQRFIKKSTHWAHIDMAGPAFLLESNLGTGFGVRTLVEYSTPKNSSRPSVFHFVAGCLDRSKMLLNSHLRLQEKTDKFS